MQKIDPETGNPWNPGLVNFRAEQIADLDAAEHDFGRAVELPDGVTLVTLADTSPAYIDFEGAAADEFERRTGHRAPSGAAQKYLESHEWFASRVRPATPSLSFRTRMERRIIRWRAFCDRNAVFLTWALFPLKAAALASIAVAFWIFWTGSPA